MTRRAVWAVGLAQQLARAAGPVCAAALASVAGYGVVFAILAAMLAAVSAGLLPASRRSE